MQAFHYGAHELIELHEVLNHTIDTINTFQLYQPYIREPELQQIMHKQLSFAITEYNNMVNYAHGLGASAAVPYRPMRQASLHASGVMRQTLQPDLHASQLDERDVASVMLGLHKSGATCKLHAALETANLQIRQMLLQSVTNCANQAYEVWDYLYRRGYYPMVTLPAAESAELLRGYRPVQPLQNHPLQANPVQANAAHANPIHPMNANPLHANPAQTFPEHLPGGGQAEFSGSHAAHSLTGGAAHAHSTAAPSSPEALQTEFAAESLHTEPDETQQPARKKASRSSGSK